MMFALAAASMVAVQLLVLYLTFSIYYGWQEFCTRRYHLRQVNRYPQRWHVAVLKALGLALAWPFLWAYHTVDDIREARYAKKLQKPPRRRMPNPVLAPAE